MYGRAAIPNALVAVFASAAAFVLAAWTPAAVAQVTPNDSEAETDAPRVSVDWSGVPDDVTGACQLQGLQGLFYQSLLESGFAVVDAPAPDVIRATVGVSDDGFVLRASFDDTARDISIEDSAVVPKPNPCDSTIQLLLARGLASLVQDVQAKRETQTRRWEQNNPQEQSAETVLETQQPSAWGGAFRIGAVGPFNFDHLRPQIGARVSHRVLEQWQLTFGVTGSLGRAPDLLILEPELNTGFWFLPNPDWRFGAVASFLVHSYTGSGDGDASGAEPGLTLGAAVEFFPDGDGFGLGIGARWRTPRIRHARAKAGASDEIYDSYNLEYDLRLLWAF